MKKQPYLLAHDEAGAAVVEIVFAVPILVLLIAALLDLSTYIKCNIALDSAATAAVRYCMDNPDKAKSPADVSSYLARVEPELGNISVSVTRGSQTSELYTHLMYADYTETPLARENSRITSQPVFVDVSYSGSYWTFVGKGISLASGGDGNLSVSCRKAGVIDLTDGSTW